MTFGGERIDIKLDPGFKPFFDWCKGNGVPIIVVSRYIYTQLSAPVIDLKFVRAVG